MSIQNSLPSGTGEDQDNAPGKVTTAKRVICVTFETHHATRLHGNSFLSVGELALVTSSGCCRGSRPVVCRRGVQSRSELEGNLQMGFGFMHVGGLWIDAFFYS